jgi:hypothetical protein
MREADGPKNLNWTIIVLSIVAVASLSLIPTGIQGSVQVTDSSGDYPEDGPIFHRNFTQYFDYPSMTEYLKQMQVRFKDIMELWSLGQTHEGRDIWCVKLSDNPGSSDDGSPGSEPDAILVGAHHANEWISYETALYVMTFLLENYGGTDLNGTAATYLVDSREIFIVPMLNPDGTQYAHESERGWRKNREPNYAYDHMPGSYIDPELVPSSYGVDLNRNYGWMWHVAGGSNAILARGGSYRGPPDNVDDDGDAIVQVDIRNGILPGPDEGVDEDPWDGIDNDGDGEVDEDPAGGFTSEETIALKELGDNQDFTVGISYHSYSELVLWPWGYTNEEAPDGPHMAQLGNRMAEMNGYRPMQGYDLYMVTGDMTDWFYSQYGTYAYTFEVGRTHNIPAGEIVKHAQLNLDPSLYLIYAADNPFISYIRTDENSTKVWRTGDTMRVELSFDDEGYPIPFNNDTFDVVYRWDRGPWKRSPLTALESGNLTGSFPAETDDGRVELYFEMEDDRGNLFTEPAYAPYSLIKMDFVRDPIFGLYFGFDTLLVLLFTLGISWGGFSFGIVKSVRSQRRMEGMNG